MGRRGQLGATCAAIALAFSLTAAGGAEAATGLCASLGLTHASVRGIFGPGLALSLQPNQGEDAGVCLIARRGQRFAASYGPGAVVELYSPAMAPGVRSGYEHGATSRRHLAGLGAGAVLSEGPPISGVSPGGPVVLFGTASYFVTIEPNAPYRQEKVATAAQEIALAHVIHG
jgi:hypothetical protein